MLPGDPSATGVNSQKPKSKQRAWRPLVDLYGKTFLAKVAHIFIVYHPLKERKSVSVTKHKIWGIEICPKMSLSRPDFTFWALSQDRDAPGQIYLTTSDHHGCRNLGQQEKFFALGTSYSRLSTPVSWYLFTSVLYFFTFLPELQMAASIPILRISVPNLIQGHLRTWSWLIWVTVLILIRVGLY